MTEKETDSGAHALPYRIIQKHLGKFDHRIMSGSMEDLVKLTGRDYAFELRGDELHIYQVQVT